MSMQIVSEQKEDPLSTHPVFLLSLWLGILVIIGGMTGPVVWYAQAYDLSEGSVSDDRAYLDFSSLEGEKSILTLQPQLPVVPAEILEKEKEQKQLEEEIRTMVSGYPIETMAPFIAKQDRVVAAFLVGIAKKESNWGRHVPTQNGRECYNYWGYKGAGSLGHGMGYGCFATPEEAIAVVGGRLHTLAIENKNETPRDMVIWKCGSSCAGHAPGSAEKWISDVDIYYSRLVALAR